MMWRKLFKLCDLAHGFIRMNVRNGKSAHFWLDDYLQIGRFIDITGESGKKYLGIQRFDMVSASTTCNAWRFRTCRGRNFRSLLDKVAVTPIHDPNYGKDIPHWRHAVGE